TAMGMPDHAAEQLIRATRTNARIAGLAASAVPRQLPCPAPHFTGRAAELEMLTGLLDRADVEPGITAIAAISGTAGVGETALAVYWAHRVAHRFPDGQLFLDLRGSGPAGEPVKAADAIRWLLDGLGVPPDRVPASPEAHIGLYRSLLAARQVLVV